MKVHVVGAGPTGLTIAWNLINNGYTVIVYDRKEGPGGSWWEPEGERNYHAYRSVFRKGFINTRNFLNELGLKWNDYFGKVPSNDLQILKYFEISDYPKIIWLALKVFTNPEKYKKINLKDCVQNFSEISKKLFEHLPYSIDGVCWCRMSAYEFFQSINMVTFDIPGETQIISGRKMFGDIKNVLESKGVIFKFHKELLKVSYHPDSYYAMFTDGDEIDDGMLVLAVDNGPARWLIEDNWGGRAQKKLESGMYTCMNIIMYYDRNMAPLPKTDVEYAMNSELKILAKAYDNTVSCLICETDKIKNIPSGPLVEMIRSQTGLPKPLEYKICWGSSWNGSQWTHSQSSGAYPLEGTLPFFGESSKVALVGMMSPRHTPYASIEAATEVANTFTKETFGIGKIYFPFTLTLFLLFIIFSCLLLIWFFY